jgi:FkbM family methyltransferase
MKPAPTDPPEIRDTLWHGIEGEHGWDIGANCGQTVTHMLDRFTYVTAFEPAEECWPYLDKLPQDRLTIKHIGLSDKNADVDLIALPDKIDTGQLVTAGTHGMEWNPDHETGLIRTVPCRTVDSLLAPKKSQAPDFMKIDVEGHEMKVLFGAKRTLATHRPTLLIEFHSRTLHEQVSTLLDSFGYHVTTIRHPHYKSHSDMWFTHGWLKAHV